MFTEVVRAYYEVENKCRAQMTSAAMTEVQRQVNNLLTRHSPQPRQVIFTAGEPLNFYGARDGKLYANGKPFHVKGVK